MSKAQRWIEASVTTLSVTSSCRLSSCHCLPRSPISMHPILLMDACLTQVAICLSVAGRLLGGSAFPLVGKSIHKSWSLLSFNFVVIPCIDAVVIDLGWKIQTLYLVCSILLMVGSSSITSAVGVFALSAMYVVLSVVVWLVVPVASMLCSFGWPVEASDPPRPHRAEGFFAGGRGT